MARANDDVEWHGPLVYLEERVLDENTEGLYAVVGQEESWVKSTVYPFSAVGTFRK